MKSLIRSQHSATRSAQQTRGRARRLSEPNHSIATKRDIVVRVVAALVPFAESTLRDSVAFERLMIRLGLTQAQLQHRLRPRLAEPASPTGYRQADNRNFSSSTNAS